MPSEYSRELDILADNFGTWSDGSLGSLIEFLYRNSTQVIDVIHYRCAIAAINARDYERLHLLFTRLCKHDNSYLYNLIEYLTPKQRVLLNDYVRCYKSDSNIEWCVSISNKHISLSYPNILSGTYNKMIYSYSFYLLKDLKYPMPMILNFVKRNKIILKKYPLIWFYGNQTIAHNSVKKALRGLLSLAEEKAFICGTHLGFYRCRRIEFQPLRLELIDRINK